MIVEYTRNGSNSGSGGSGDQMIDYLLQKNDHKGEERESVRVVGGDAELLRLSLNSGRFQNEYTSLVLNFGDDKLTKEDEREILESFLDCSFPSLPIEQRPAMLAVAHDDEHVHVSMSKEDPVTHKKINGYVHSVDMKRIDAWKRMINAKYNFESDPNDPKNISFTVDPRNPSNHPFSKMYHKNKDEFVQNIAIAVKRKLDSDNTIKTRDDIIRFIENGLKIKVVDNSRNESISVENKIKKGGQNIRLKGFDGLFNKDFDSKNYKSDFIEKLSEDYRSKREERFDIAKEEYEQLYAKKSEFIISRYSKPLKNVEYSQFEGRIGTMSVRQQTKEEINYREKFIEAKKQEYKQQLLDKKQIKNLVRDKIIFNSVRKRKVSTLLKNLADQIAKERMQMEDWYQQIRDQSIQRLHAEELTKILKIEANEAKHKLVQSRINENIDKAKGKGQTLVQGNEEGFKDYIAYCKNAGKMTISSLVLSTSQQLKPNDYQMILSQSQKILFNGSEKHIGVLYSKFDEQKKKTHITILNSRENYKTNELIDVNKEKQKELKDFFKVKNINELLKNLKDEEVKKIEKEEENENGYYKKYDTKSIARTVRKYNEQFRSDGKFRTEIREYRELVLTQKLERNERRDAITQQQVRISARRDRNAERRKRINPNGIATTFQKLSNSYIEQAKKLRELKQKRNKNSGLSL